MKAARKLLLVLIWGSIICLLSPNALAYEDAANKIKIFTQNDYTSSANWSLRGTKNPTTLKVAGCHLFSYAHAYQWLSGNKADDSLLRELISVCRNPSDGPDSGKATEDKNHTYCGGLNGKSHSNSTEAYNAWMKYKLGDSLVIKGSSDTKKLVNSESSLKAFYDNGGVIISNPDGHYVVSVGYRVYNGTTYIEIVDSSRWTTIHTDGKTAYDFTNITKSAEYSPNKGDRFWVTWSTYKGFRHDNAFSRNQVTILPTSIQLSMTTGILYLDNTLTLSASAYPSNANQGIIWTTSNSSIATVNNGVVTPAGTGTVTITATSSADSSVKASCVLEVKYNGTGMIKFNTIIVPYRYKLNSNGFSWKSGSGSITSDVNLKEVFFTLVHPDGKSYTWRYPTDSSKTIGAKQLDMATVSSIIKFSNISSTGQGYFEIRAVDIAGRSLTKGRIIQVSKTEGVTASTDSACSNTQYRITTRIEEPQLIDSSTLNGHTYERYFATYSWTDAKSYAERLGGHLVTINSAEENNVVFSLVNKDPDFGAWIGAYRDGNTWKWVKAEEPFNYTNWNTADNEPDGQWNLENYGAMMRSAGKWRDSALNNYAWKYFVVEYEPTLVQEILLSGETAPMAGDVFSVSTTILPEDAENKAVLFSSSDPSVATIDLNTGLVTTIREGELVISALAQDGSGVIGQYSLYVNRKSIPVTGIEIGVDETVYATECIMSAMPGDSFKIYYLIAPENADNKGVYFYSTDSDIAIVDDTTSMVSVLKPGSCEIIAVTVDGEFESRLKITVPYASGTCGDNIEWMLTSDGTLNLLGTGAMPGEWGGTFPWDSYKDSIRSINIMDGITSIAPTAFDGCYFLESVQLPNSLQTIGESAFLSDGTLATINIPENVNHIGANPFLGCDLTSISVSSQNQWYTAVDGVLFSKDKKTLVAFPGGRTGSYMIPSTVKIVAEGAFQYSHISDVIIPEGVVTLESNSFCAVDNLTNIQIPSTVTSIHCLAFQGCSNLTSFTVASANSQYCASDGILYNKNMSVIIRYPAGKTDSSFTTPQTVSTIGEMTFNQCKNLTEVTFTDNVVAIEDEVFMYCVNLRKIVIPKSVKSIAYNLFTLAGDKACIYCFEDSTAHSYAINHSLQFVLIDTPLNNPDFTLPAFVHTIEEEAFFGISAKRIRLPESITSIGSYAFANCPHLSQIYIPEGCENIAATAFSGVTELTIYGADGSYAEWFASKRGFKFVSVNE